MVAVMTVLDAVFYPLETDREPWYYFLFLGFFILLTIVGLALSFRWRNIFTTSKKETLFSYIAMPLGFLLLILSLIAERISPAVGALGFGFMIMGISTLLSTAFGLRTRPVMPSLRTKPVMPSADIARAFPKEISRSVEAVERQLKRGATKACGLVGPYTYYPECGKVFLPDTVTFPDAEFTSSDPNAQMIYWCLQTRNKDRHIREKYLKKILRSDCPRWAVLYLIEASVDCAVEIVIALYDGMDEKIKGEIAEYYRKDLRKFRHDYSKTISYWNAYYRAVYPHYRDYPGYKLFTECYGFQKRYYREADRIPEETMKYDRSKKS